MQSETTAITPATPATLASPELPTINVVEKSLLKPFGRPLAEIVADLQKPLPERFLSTRKQGGKLLTYVSWHYTNRLMDYFTGAGWEGSVANIHTTEKEVYVVYRVVIHAAEGSFSREATGSEQLANNAWGEAIAKAESQAFRRACARWGLALYLYKC